jgi:hypothetical protein
MIARSPLPDVRRLLKLWLKRFEIEVRLRQ